MQFLARLSWDDSRQLKLVEVKLNEELGELSAEARQLADAEKYFRDALDLRRSTFKSGREPARFYVDSFFNKQLPFDANHEMGPFCGYVETQLRLARILAQRGRAYAAELALGECEMTIDLVCAMAPDVVRYRVARANCWAQAAQLLEDERPSEAVVARQWAAAIWRDTLSHFPHAQDYCSDVNGDCSDVAWFERTFPGDLAAQAPFEYQPHSPDAVKQTAFFQHALGIALYQGGQWKGAMDAFMQSAERRESGHAFDWLRMAMTAWQMGDADAARQWYERARAAATEMHGSGELFELQEEVRKQVFTPPEDEQRHKTSTVDG